MRSGTKAPQIERFRLTIVFCQASDGPLRPPTRPKTPKVCVITLTAQVAPKQAPNLPGMMQTGNGADSPARSYNAYFWAFSKCARPTRPRHWPGHPRRQRCGPRSAGPHPFRSARTYLGSRQKGRPPPLARRRPARTYKRPGQQVCLPPGAQNAKGAPGPLGPDAPFLIGPRPGV